MQGELWHETEGDPKATMVEVSDMVTPTDIDEVFEGLPIKKAPGPDKIPNKLLKALREDIRSDLANAIS